MSDENTAIESESNGEKKRKQAVDGARGTFFWVDPEQLTIVNDPTRTDLYDPRVEREVDEELAQSLKQDGNLIALRVRKNGEALEVIDGRQRVKAALWANKNLPGMPVKLKVELWKGSDQEAFAVMVEANSQRTDDTPMERARKINVALNVHGFSKQRVAAMFRCSSLTTLDNHLALLDLAAPVQKLVESGKLTETVARELVKLPREKQLETAKELLDKGVAKGAAGVAAVRGAKKGKAVQEKDKATKKLRTRPQIEAVIAHLKSEGHGADSELLAVFKWVAGSDAAISPFPKLRTLIRESQK